MTREEFNELVTAAANPDTGIEALSKLKEEGASVFDTIDSLTADIESKDNRIRDLQDSNMKLFLKVGTPEEVKEPADEVAELETEFNAMFSESF